MGREIVIFVQWENYFETILNCKKNTIECCYFENSKIKIKLGEFLAESKYSPSRKFKNA